MPKKTLIVILIALVFSMLMPVDSYAFWLWTPKDKKFQNPKYAVKDSPKEQYQWAQRFYKAGDFKRAAEEFARLAQSYPDSEYAPEAQYYAGRSYEELGKYWFAYQNYQKTVENYPYTDRMNELLEREYNIAGIFANKDTSKLLDMELSMSIDRSVIVYGKIVENSPFGELADKSLYNMADSYRRMLKYNEAIEAYEKIINDHPESKLVPEAKYQLAYTRYQASLSPEYDQESTDEALREFKQIAKTTHIPKVAEEADSLITELKRRKANSTLKIAQFYEKRGKPKSALMYYKDVAAKFPGTEAAQEAEKKIEILEKRISKK